MSATGQHPPDGHIVTIHIIIKIIMRYYQLKDYVAFTLHTTAQQ